MRIYRCISILVLALITLHQAFAANTDISGATSSISNGFTASQGHPEGSHFHSTNLSDSELPPGNPPINVPNVAEVGGFFGDEEIRGTSELALGNTAVTATAFFDVLDMFALGISPEVSGIDGLYGQGSYEGDVNVFAYAGDNMEELSDYQIPPISDTPLLTVEVPVGYVAGDTFSVDVTEIYNNLVADLASDPGNAATALGLRLQMADPADPNSKAITFGNFRLQLQTEVVPEPEASWLLLLGMVAILRRIRRG